MHHHIVALERIHQPLPATFNLPPGTTYTLTSYDTTPTRELLHARIRDATIVIVTTIRLDAETLSAQTTPVLRLVAIMATGADIVHLETCQKRGIRVTNAPAANLDAVSEHALSLYFAARRRTVLMDRLTRQVPSQWKQHGSLNRYMRFADGHPPLTCGDEVMGIIGYGALGKRIAALGRALGMRIMIAERKYAPSSASDALPRSDQEEPRVPFGEVLRQATVIVLALPRHPDTLRLLSNVEFAQMNPYAVLVNIARGGIVDEAAVVHALKQGQISGYATDVFAQEPVEGAQDSPLLSEEAKELNITMSPHLAWFSHRTLTNLGRILGQTVEAWVSGNEINVIA